MDSSGPWASYTYNGLPASQAPPPGSLGSSSAGQRTVADLQAMGNPQAAASQLLLAGMSPAAVAVATNSSFPLGNYDSTVFSSLFHHQKQQHRSHQVVGQGGQMEQSSPWTPQTNSLGNPFGVLPHQASQKTNPNPSKGENTFSAHLIPPFAHSASSYGNVASTAAPNLPFVPQKTAPKVPIFTPKVPPKHKAPPETRYNPIPTAGISVAAAAAAASVVINNAKPSNIVVHRSFPPHLQPQCRSYPSPDSDYQQHRNTPDSVSSGPYGDSDCHMSMERPSPNPSSPYYNMASPESCVYSKANQHERQPPPQQQQQQQPPVPPQQQFPMKPHNSWDEKRSVVPPGRYNYSENENNNAFHVSDQQHYQSTINLSDLHGGSGGGEELLAHGGSDSEDYERNKRQRRNKRARKSDSPEKINRQLTLLQPVHAEDGYAATALGFHSRVAFPPLPQHQPGVHQQHPQHQQHAHHQAQQHEQQQHQQQNNYHSQEQQQSKETRSLIDEELGFLEMDSNNKKSSGPTKPTIQLKKDQPAFMDSYIKFLSGDQDNSLCTTSVRSGRKSPLRQRGRAIPQKVVGQDTQPLQQAPQPQQQQQQQQHQQVQLQQQHQQHQQHSYQIHQQQQLDPSSHREDANEHSGRGRKRSLPVEGQNEGVSIAGLVEQNLLNALSVCANRDDENVPDVADDISDEDIDYSQKQFQPKVVLMRMSPGTLRKYSQSDDSNSVSDIATPEPQVGSAESSRSQIEPQHTAQATENGLSASKFPCLTGGGLPVKDKDNVEAKTDPKPVDLIGELKKHGVGLPFQPKAMDSLQWIINKTKSMPAIFNVEKTCSSDGNGPGLSWEPVMLPQHSKDSVEILQAVFNSSTVQTPKTLVKNVSPVEVNDTACSSVGDSRSQDNLLQDGIASSLFAHSEREDSPADQNKEKKEKCPGGCGGSCVFDICRESQELSQPKTDSELYQEVLKIVNDHRMCDGARLKTRMQQKPAKIAQKRSSAPDNLGSNYKKPSLTAKAATSPSPTPNVPSIDEEMAELLGPAVVKQINQLKDESQIAQAAPDKSNIPNEKQLPPGNMNKAMPASVKRKLFPLSEPVSETSVSVGNAKSDKDLSEKNSAPSVGKINKLNALEPKLPPNARRKKYRRGTFVMDVVEKKTNPNAKLYRVDGPELKQVFEAFIMNGEKLYKSTSSYSGWSLDDYRRFSVVEVEYYKDTAKMTIVRVLLPESPKKTQRGARTKSVIATEEFEDVFRTYIQALLSQAMDDGFLQTVYEENVEFFINSVDKIDELNNQRVTKLKKLYNFPQDISEIILQWPLLNWQQLSVCNMCQCCKKKRALYFLTGDGDMHCKKTLLPVDLEQNDAVREFTVCRPCCTKAYKIHKVCHLKYLLYNECQTMVRGETTTDKILQHVHSNWFEKLFKNLQQNWAEVDCMKMKEEEGL